VTRLATLEDFFASRGESPLVEQEHEAVMRATLALEHASETVRAYTRRSFDAITETVEVEGTGTPQLMLPDPPITEVFSVYEVDHYADPDESTLIEATDYRLRSGAGILQRVDGGYWMANGIYTRTFGVFTYQVEMVHGYVLPDDDPDSSDGPLLPQDVQMVVLSLASRQYEIGEEGTASTTGGGRTAIQIGTYREEFSDGSSTTTATRTTTGGLTPLEAGVLDRYRLPRIG
jgi:hypothetical protein